MTKKVSESVCFPDQEKNNIVYPVGELFHANPSIMMCFVGRNRDVLVH